MSKIEFKVVRTGKTTNANFSFDTGIKMEFQVECLKNKQTMTEVIQSFMETYTIQSRQMRANLESKKE